MKTCQQCPQTVYGHLARNGQITHDLLCYYHAKLRDYHDMADGLESVARNINIKLDIRARRATNRLWSMTA